MQIREIKLTELYTVYEILKSQKKDMEYKEYEDLVYEMIKENYKILSIIDKEKAITYAGIKIQTDLTYKRHLYVNELITDTKENSSYYNKEMLSYLIDYARINQCKNIVIPIDNHNELSKLAIANNFKKLNLSYFTKVI